MSDQGPRNRVNRDAARFGLAAARARQSIEMALQYFATFSADGSTKDAEFARENAHASIDAYCDAIRAAHRAMGDQ